MELTRHPPARTLGHLMPDTEIERGALRGRGKTRAMVLRYALKGLNGQEIADKVGISRQAANKHLRGLRETGELPELNGNGLAGQS